jgi:hypothetical protein
MDQEIQSRFINNWNKYFPEAELPIGFYYTNELLPNLGPMKKPQGWRCLIGDLARVRRGNVVVFEAENITCGGGNRYAGFSCGLRPGFEAFLSHDESGKQEGERYKKSPELVKPYLEDSLKFKAPAKYLVCKRWDLFGADETPVVVIFFAAADVLSGLFTLANFDEVDLQAVIAPFGSGCGSIIQNPVRELQKSQPKCVLGMFDVSARPFIGAGELSFAAPWPKFERMINNMEQSFLITPAWQKVQRRLKRENEISMT